MKNYDQIVHERLNEIGKIKSLTNRILCYLIDHNYQPAVGVMGKECTRCGYFKYTNLDQI